MEISISDLTHLMKNIGSLDGDGIRFFMSKILASEPEIGWEFGPDPIDEGCLVMALTCNGDLDLLNRLNEELALPIKGEGWTLVSGAVPKQWDKYFEILNDDGEVIGIEGSEWMWSLRGLDGIAHIDINLPANLEGKKFDLICSEFILFSGEIGENNFARLVEVEDVSFGLRSAALKYKKMELFRKEFVKWFPSAAYSEFLRSF